MKLFPKFFKPDPIFILEHITVQQNNVTDAVMLISNALIIYSDDATTVVDALNIHTYIQMQ